MLNTRAEPSPGVQVELIGDGRHYLEWLSRAGLIDASDRVAIEAQFSPADLDDAAATARDLRERLRLAVTAWMADPSALISVGLIDALNAMMATGRRFTQLHPDGRGGLAVSEHRLWTRPGQLLVPIAEAWARLLTDGDPALVHRCPGCTIIFYDRTKAHTRRWCSMALCGNRAKVRRHRANHVGKGNSDAAPDAG